MYYKYCNAHIWAICACSLLEAHGTSCHSAPIMQTYPNCSNYGSSLWMHPSTKGHVFCVQAAVHQAHRREGELQGTGDAAAAGGGGRCCSAWRQGAPCWRISQGWHYAGGFQKPQGASLTAPCSGLLPLVRIQVCSHGPIRGQGEKP